MSTHKNINPFSRQNNDTGFASNSNYVGGRFINKDGSYNLVKEGMSFRKRFSMFHDMLNLPVWKFIAVIFLFYLAINILFTLIYLLIGAAQLDGLASGSSWQTARQVFYFSTQTFTTVGYGHVSPVGDAVNIVSAVESLTGCFRWPLPRPYLRPVSKPRSYLVFSDEALISPYKDGIALMFRFAAFKDKHSLTDLEIRVNGGLLVMENDKPEYKYFTLTLERTPCGKHAAQLDGCSPH